MQEVLPKIDRELGVTACIWHNNSLCQIRILQERQFVPEKVSSRSTHQPESVLSYQNQDFPEIADPDKQSVPSSKNKQKETLKEITTFS